MLVEIMARTEEQRVRLVLISGEPIGEPIAWNGPIVMNTDGERQTAFEEYKQGTFINSVHPSMEDGTTKRSIP